MPDPFVQKVNLQSPTHLPCTDLIQSKAHEVNIVAITYIS